MNNKVKCSKFVENLKEYKTASQQVWKLTDKKQREDVIKADWNESVVPPSPKTKKSVLDFIKNYPLNWYPDVEASKLKLSLEKYVKLSKSYIQVFNGSDAALEYVVRAFIDQGDEVIIMVPTYDNFRVYAESCGAKVKNVSYSFPFVADENKILEAMTSKTKIIYLVNPNNPTGVFYSEKQVRKILEYSPKTLLIVDEAYYEYSGQTMSALIKKYQNLIITRSFSKAFSLAGLRCGYILSNPENIRIVNKIRVGKNTNSLAQVAAKAAIDDINYTKNYVKNINFVREFFVEKLLKMSIKTINTHTNFILVYAEDAANLIKFLEKRKIYIRDMSNQPQLKNFVRITIGTRKQMEKIVEAMRAFAVKRNKI